MLTTLVSYLALTVLIPSAPTPTQLLDKSPAQVVALSRPVWVTYYTAKVSDSRADWANAESYYGRALGQENDRQAAQTPSRQKLVQDLRSNMRAFTRNCVEVGIAHEGLNTGWYSYSSIQHANIEEILHYVLTETDPPDRKLPVSDEPIVRQAVKLSEAKVRTHLKGAKGIPGYTLMTYEDVLTISRNIDSLFKQLLPHIEPLPTDVQARILGYYHHTLHVTNPENLTERITPLDEPTPEQLLGKTAPEIVNMGRTAWFEFYTGKEGESTAAMSHAEHYYGWALTRENNRLAEFPDTGLIDSLRKNLTVFRIHCIEVGRAYTGGGTLWNLAYAATVADVEELIHFTLTSKDPQNAKLLVSTQSKVWEALKKGRTGLASQRKHIEELQEFTHIGFDQVQNDLNAAQAAFSQAVPLIKDLPQPLKDRLFGFYLSNAKITHPEPTP